MKLIEDRPNGQSIQIWECRSCEATRACRPGWLTRCHVCLDERTDPSIAEAYGMIFESMITTDEERQKLRDIYGVGANEWIDDVDAHGLIMYNTVQDELLMHERPGWSVLAADIAGLPWGGHSGRRSSHGVWGRHDACGTVQSMRAVECAVCPPTPGSRTHRARAESPQLLYLVAFDDPAGVGSLVKFGHGSRRRVLDHISGGAVPLLVLRATFRQVVKAERKLAARYGCDAVGAITGLPASFERGTEVVPAGLNVDLHRVLSGTGVTDVTELFSIATPERAPVT
ncbi:hypothetical protein EV383_0683 [Pseudonocardia sediminis]|uniref:Uncharacterized protein n=1 Tax=Pseudonocardia sediminis TaxID=1397368 RepID=A0A4Q7UUY5_PSEST|nr:hypothetical protein [Pseudonocardia sediminis]RZT83863.1 hypothetical protein EV383_0683 [Pseudonocardia sediminis]